MLQHSGRRNGCYSKESHVLDHVVGISSGAASAVTALRTVNVGREVVWEVRDFEAALQASLPPQDTPEDKRDISISGWTGIFGVITITKTKLMTCKLPEACSQISLILHPKRFTLAVARKHNIRVDNKYK